MVRVSTDFPPARGADETEDLAAIDVEVEVIEDQAVPEAHHDVAHADDGFALLCSDGWGGGLRVHAASHVDGGEEHGEDAVHHDHEEDRLHHPRARCSPSDPSAAAHPHALHAGHRGDGDGPAKRPCTCRPRIGRGRWSLLQPVEEHVRQIPP